MMNTLIARINFGGVRCQCVCGKVKLSQIVWMFSSKAIQKSFFWMFMLMMLNRMPVQHHSFIKFLHHVPSAQMNLWGCCLCLHAHFLHRVKNLQDSFTGRRAMLPCIRRFEAVCTGRGVALNTLSVPVPKTAHLNLLELKFWWIFRRFFDAESNS